MLWQDVENSAIRVVQGKTGAKLRIPLHPELARILDAWSAPFSGGGMFRE
jgi:hypothetical protein